jgi:hypothetical protein
MKQQSSVACSVSIIHCIYQLYIINWHEGDDRVYEVTLRL